MGEPRRPEKRKQFLKAIYDLADGNPNQYVYWDNVTRKLGWNSAKHGQLEEGLAYADYLAARGLLSIMVDEGTIYRITADGIDEVEKEGRPSVSDRLPQMFNVVRADAARVEDASSHIRESL